MGVTLRAPLDPGRAHRPLDRQRHPLWGVLPCDSPHLTPSCPSVPLTDGGRPASPSFPLWSCRPCPVAFLERQGEQEKGKETETCVIGA